jgi:hypothetical protein
MSGEGKKPWETYTPKENTESVKPWEVHAEKKKPKNKPTESSTKDVSTDGEVLDGNLGDNSNSVPSDTPIHTNQEGEDKADVNYVETKPKQDAPSITNMFDDYKSPEQLAADKEGISLRAFKERQASLAIQQELQESYDKSEVFEEVRNSYYAQAQEMAKGMSDEELQVLQSQTAEAINKDPRVIAEKSRINKASSESYNERMLGLANEHHGVNRLKDTEDALEAIEEELAPLTEFVDGYDTHGAWESKEYKERAANKESLELQRDELVAKKSQQITNIDDSINADKYNYKVKGRNVKKSEYVEWLGSEEYRDAVANITKDKKQLKGYDVLTDADLDIARESVNGLAVTTDPDLKETTDRTIRGSVEDTTTKGIVRGIVGAGRGVYGWGGASAESIEREFAQFYDYIGATDMAKDARKEADRLLDWQMTENQTAKKLSESLEAQSLRNKDAIDLLQDGEVSKASGMIRDMAAESLIYTGLAVINPALVYGAVKGQKRQEYAKEVGYDAKKGVTASGLKETDKRRGTRYSTVAATTEMLSEQIKIKVAANQLQNFANGIKKVSNRAASNGASDAVVTSFRKNAVKEIGKYASGTGEELVGEFGAGFSEAYSDAMVAGEGFDVSKAVRAGGNEALATVPMTMLGLPSLVVNAGTYNTKEAQTSLDANNVLREEINNKYKDASKEDKALMEKYYFELASKDADAALAATELIKKATPEQNKDLTDIQRELNRIEETSSLITSEEGVKVLEDRATELNKQKEGLLKEIGNQEGVVTPKKETAKESSKPSEKLDKETVQKTDTFTKDEQAEKVNKAKEESDKGTTPSNEQIDKALKIVEPLASNREAELTLEQTEQVYEALGENANNAIDISKLEGKSAVEVYNELDNAKTPVKQPTGKSTQEEISKTADVKEGKLDSFISSSTNAMDWLNKMEAEVKKAEKEALGSLLPLATIPAKIAISAAKVAVTAGKTAAQAAQAGIKAVESSDWYKALNENEQSQASDSVRIFFNKKPKVKDTIATETDGLTDKESFKQAFTEYVDSTRAKFKLEIKEIKDKIKDFKNKKKDVISTVKEYMKDFKSNKYLPSELSRAMTAINNATTDKMLNKATDNLISIIDKSSRRQFISDSKKKVSRLKGKASSKLGNNTDAIRAYNALIAINPNDVPSNLQARYSNTLNTLLSEGSLGDVAKTVRGINSLVEGVNKTIKEDVSDTTDAELKEELTKDEKEKAHEVKKNVEIKEAVKAAKDLTRDKIKGRENRDIAKTLLELTPSDLADMSLAQLRELNKALIEVSNGIITNKAFKAHSEISAKRSADSVIKSDYKSSKWYNVVANIVGFVSGKSGADVFVRRNPLEYIDQTLGNFNNSNLKKAVFDRYAKANSRLRDDIARLEADTEKAIHNLGKENSNKRWESNTRIKVYQLQRFHESNPDNAKMPSAEAYVEETTKKGSSSRYNDKSKVAIKDVFDRLKDSDGEVTAKGIYEKLTPEEKAVIKKLDEVVAFALPMAEHTSRVVRGEEFIGEVDYVTSPVFSEADALSEASDYANNMMGLNPSTSAGSQKAKTRGAKSISFDAVGDAMNAAREVLTDYHMTPAIRVGNKVVKKLETDATTEESKEVFKAVKNAHDESLRNDLSNMKKVSSTTDAVFNYANKKGYMMMLGGVFKAASEFASNTFHAGTYNTSALISGQKITSEESIQDLADLAKEVGATQTTRMFGDVGIDSKRVEATLFKRGEGKSVKEKPGKLKDKTSGAVDFLKETDKSVDKLVGGLIGLSDKLVGTKVWVGSFYNEFKNITGSELDLQKAINDKSYQEANRAAFTEAADKANSDMADSVASMNPYQGILKNQRQASDHAGVQLMKTFDTYMTNFRVFEFNSAKKAVVNLANPKTMTRGKAARLLAATVGRMMLYDQIKGALFGAMLSFFGYSDDDEDKNALSTVLSNSFISTLLTLTAGRAFGNVQNAISNYYIEQANKQYGEGFTYDGEYDMYKDALVFNTISETGKSPEMNTLINMTGALSPMLKRGYSYLNKSPKSDAKQKQMKLDIASELFMFWLSVPREISDLLKARQRNAENYTYEFLQGDIEEAKPKKQQVKKQTRPTSRTFDSNTERKPARKLATPSRRR